VIGTCWDINRRSVLASEFPNGRYSPDLAALYPKSLSAAEFRIGGIRSRHRYGSWRTIAPRRSFFDADLSSRVSHHFPCAIYDGTKT